MAGAELDVRMPFAEHLEELRARLLKSLLGLAAALAVALAYHSELVAFAAWPHLWAMELGGVPAEKQRFLAGSYDEPVWATMKLCFIAALFASSPWVGYQLWAFVSAGLYRRERRCVLVFAPLSFLLFVGGCAFGYRVLIPYCLCGMARFVNPSVIDPSFTFSPYLSLLMALTVVLGALFQLPLVMAFLSRLGLVPSRAWRRVRRAAIVAEVALASLLSPGDLVSLAAFTLPLLLLYEVGVWAAALAAQKQTV